jgi:hypothetical protein
MSDRPDWFTADAPHMLSPQEMAKSMADRALNARLEDMKAELARLKQHHTDHPCGPRCMRAQMKLLTRS